MVWAVIDKKIMLQEYSSEAKYGDTRDWRSRWSLKCHVKKFEFNSISNGK